MAEGVETVVQLDRLRALGCDFGQGWYFGRPAAAADLGANPVAALRSWQVDGRWVADSPAAISTENAP